MHCRHPAGRSPLGLDACFSDSVRILPTSAAADEVLARARSSEEMPFFLDHEVSSHRHRSRFRQLFLGTFSSQRYGKVDVESRGCMAANEIRRHFISATLRYTVRSCKGYMVKQQVYCTPPLRTLWIRNIYILSVLYGVDKLTALGRSIHRAGMLDCCEREARFS